MDDYKIKQGIEMALRDHSWLAPFAAVSFIDNGDGTRDVLLKVDMCVNLDDGRVVKGAVSVRGDIPHTIGDLITLVSRLDSAFRSATAAMPSNTVSLEIRINRGR